MKPGEQHSINVVGATKTENVAKITPVANTDKR